MLEAVPEEYWVKLGLGIYLNVWGMHTFQYFTNPELLYPFNNVLVF